MSRARFVVSSKEERTMDGIVFDSRSEMERYADLKLLQRGKVIRNLELQPTFPVEINGAHFCTYTADFAYVNEYDQKIVEDVKSAGTEKDTAFRLRKKAAELFYGIQIFSVDKSGNEMKSRRRKHVAATVRKRIRQKE
jgi:hypothetical protein